MRYTNCPRCGLMRALRFDQVAWESCPRCKGRDGIDVPVYVTGRRLWPPPTAAQASAAEVPAASTDRPAAASGDDGQLTIDRWPVDGGWVWRLRGKLDLTTAAPLNQKLRELQAESDRLVIDLRELSFMDCAGLAVIVAADLTARQAGAQLEVLCRPQQIQNVLRLTRRRSSDVADDHRGRPSSTRCAEKLNILFRRPVAGHRWLDTAI